MLYLETGKLPQATKRATKDRSIPAWPLPETGVTESTERWPMHYPMTETLIDIAIAEKRPDEVIRWYDQRQIGAVGWGWGVDRDDTVAEAVAGAYPDRALVIWKKLAEAYIAQTQPRAYAAAAGFLRKVHRLLEKRGKQEEWRSYLAQLRQVNARKRRLVEVLDDLVGRPIIER
ncbi:MAG: hypothetical protein HYZ81_19685 [Nitrospinae bacterium]|nr:hypothetical protein [Nitrospinota bacterium]